MVNVGRAQGNKQQVLFKRIMSSDLCCDSEEEVLHENNPVQNSILSDFTTVIWKLKKKKKHCKEKHLVYVFLSCTFSCVERRRVTSAD